MNPSAHAAASASTMMMTTITSGRRDRRLRSKSGPSAGGLMRGSVVAFPQR
jgi:hypothetical protein